jgi:PAS domain S-box-containing protein
MKLLLEAMPDAMAVVDGSGLVVLVNSAFERLLGWAAAELCGRSTDTFVPEGQRAWHSRFRAGRLADPALPGSTVNCEHSIIRHDGVAIEADITLASLTTDQGPLVTVVVRDLSEHRAMQETFRRFIESSPDAVVIADHNGKIVVVNAQTEKIFGYPRDELLGKSMDMIVPPPLLERGTTIGGPLFTSARMQTMEAGLELELSGRRRDGTPFPVEIHQSPLQTQGGMLVSSAIRDVTQRQSADQLRFRLAAIVEGSDDAIMSTDLDDRVTSWNRAATKLFGYSNQEMMGESLSLLLPPDRPGENLELLAELKRDEPIRHRDLLRRTKDGRDIIVSMTISPIRDQAGVLIGGSKVARDVTDRTRAELALAAAKEDAEKTSREYEAFSYSVAHDLRAPLRALDSFSQRLAERYGDVLDAAGQDFVRRIGESAQYMDQLIDSLLRLARLSSRELAYGPVDLSRLAEEALDRVRLGSAAREAEVVIQAGLNETGDAGLLTIVFENLLGNAWKFSRHASPARIEFGRLEAASEPVYFIRDNGAGFDMAHAAKLFGVFQRLHNIREFEGTGIGLATVQRIIGRHGGRVWAEGVPGIGATFYFTLPSRETVSQA